MDKVLYPHSPPPIFGTKPIAVGFQRTTTTTHARARKLVPDVSLSNPRYGNYSRVNGAFTCNSVEPLERIITHNVLSITTNDDSVGASVKPVRGVSATRHRQLPSTCYCPGTRCTAEL